MLPARELSNTISTGSYDWITRCWALIRLHLTIVLSACYSIFLQDNETPCGKPYLWCCCGPYLSLSPIYILFFQCNIDCILKYQNSLPPTSFRELAFSLFISMLIFRLNVTVMILTSRLALQKLRAIFAKYIATTGRLIDETWLLKWFCKQKCFFFFRSISWFNRNLITSRPRIVN